MKDNLLIGFAYDKQVRVYIADVTKEFKEASLNFEKNPVVLTTAGRSFAISGILGQIEKQKSKVTTIIDGNGDLGKISCISNNLGKTCVGVENQYPNVLIKDNKLDIASSVGTNGKLIVINDFYLKTPYISEIELFSGDITNDFCKFFVDSFQIPTAIMSSVLLDKDCNIKSVGAIMMQVLPNSSDDVKTNLNKKIDSIKSFSTLLSTKSIEEIGHDIFADFSILEYRNISFECVCSIERFITNLQLLNSDEINSIKEEKSIECVCSICRKAYEINTDLI